VLREVGDYGVACKEIVAVCHNKEKAYELAGWNCEVEEWEVK